MKKPIKYIFTSDQIKEILRQHVFQCERKSGHSYVAKITPEGSMGNVMIEIEEKKHD